MVDLGIRVRAHGRASRGDFDYEQAITFQLAVLTNLISRPFYAQLGRTSGMTLNDWRIILVVAAKPGVSQTDIVHATGLHKMTVSRCLRALKRYVRQVRDPADTRRRQVFLSDEGKAQYEAQLPLLLWRQSLLESALAPADLRKFREMLSRLIASAREWPEEPG